MQEIITKNSEETEKIGFEFVGRLKPMDIVFLIGDLGAGKTTFAKGMAKGLGITSRILSPTFVIVRKHEILNHESRVMNHGIERMYHLDLYRLGNEKEVLNVDVKEYLEDPNAVIVIEWPEVGQEIVKKDVWRVEFEITTEFERKISIDSR